MATDEYVQGPLFEPTEEERKTELIVGGYKMTWVRSYWCKTPLKTEKESDE